MPIVIIVLLTAIAISAVAAYFSIVGLAALFAATATGVIVMAATLEVGKVVTTKLIHTLWRSKRATWLLKGPLMVMVASLMCVTSLGIYGYLSKGHLEQNAPMAGIDIQSEGLQRQVDQKTNENKQLQTRLDQINNNINAFLTSGAASKGLKASSQLKAERDQIQKQIDTNNQSINGLSDKLVPLKTQASEVQAKLGPIKYVAALFGFQDPEVAVRILILLIMVAFDPLAICLIIAASVAYDDYKDSKNAPLEEKEEEEEEEEEVDAGVDWSHFIGSTPEVEVEEEPAQAGGEEGRIAGLNAQLQQEVENFKTDLHDAQVELEREKVTLEAARTAHLADVRALEADRGQLAQIAEVTADQAAAVEKLQEQVSVREAELNKREAELSDRVALLEKFFPAGTTDDQAIVTLLEKNPTILQDIINIINSEASKGTSQVDDNKPKDGPTMVIRSS